jgi:hypothetical protein
VDKITTSLGATGFAFGPGTMAVVGRATTAPSGTDASTLISVGASTAARYNFLLTQSGGNPLCGFAKDATATISAPVSNLVGVWYLWAVTKATGTVAPRHHHYNYNSALEVHQDYGSTNANSSVPITQAQLGCTATGGTASAFDGDIHIAGVWNAVLTDAQILSLALDPSPANWAKVAAANLKALWRPDDNPATTLVDLTGLGANESSHSGTSAQTDGPPLTDPMASIQYVI